MLLDGLVGDGAQRGQIVHFIDGQVVALGRGVPLGADETAQAHADGDVLGVVPVVEPVLPLGGRFHFREQNGASAHGVLLTFIDFMIV
ncbi:hypothetical protein CDO46_02965 [Pigmentiphaga sp. NML030171]|nr:hypothetical protein CDO46_02965 [Pigmentiphaga sp. NML030171]